MPKHVSMLFVGFVAAAAVACGSSDDKLKVTGFDKTELDSSGNSYVRVDGNGFLHPARSAKVWFGGQPGQVIRFESDSEMIVQAPGGKVGESVDALFVFEPGGEIKIPKAFKFVEKSTGTVNVKDLDTSDKSKK